MLYSILGWLVIIFIIIPAIVIITCYSLGLLFTLLGNLIDFFSASFSKLKQGLN